MVKSIKIELAKNQRIACRAAWSENPTAKFAWCCHHAVLIEVLTEPAENRIQFILRNKLQDEQAVRFLNFRPVRIELPVELKKAYTKWKKVRVAMNNVNAKLNKVSAKVDKAYAEWNCTEAGWKKIHAKLNKACDRRDKIWRELDKAQAEYNIALAACKENLTTLHTQDWPNHSWNGEDIF